MSAFESVRPTLHQTNSVPLQMLDWISDHGSDIVNTKTNIPIAVFEKHLHVCISFLQLHQEHSCGMAQYKFDD